MKNKVFAFLAVIVLCLTMIIPVSAVSTHVFDDTRVIERSDELEAYAQRIEDSYGYSVLVAIIDGVGDEGTYGYCESMYKIQAEKADGIALTYNYGDNVYFFYCAGKAQELFPEEIQKNTFWNAFAYTETYYDGVYAYLTAVEAIVSKAPIVTQPDDTISSETEETDTVTEAVTTDRTLSLVEDYADVLTDSEEADLISKLEALGSEYSLDIGAVTVDSYEGKDPEAFADAFYAYNGYGYGENDDGILVVFNTGEGDGNRNIAISTHGTGIDLLTDNEIAVIIEMMIGPVENGDFAGAFDNFVTECENAIDPSISIIWIPVSILIGFALAYLIVKTQASKLKTVRAQVNAADYVGNVMLTAQYDNFMYKNVRSTPKAKSSSGGSTHTSASGRTHGGGNKSF